MKKKKEVISVKKKRKEKFKKSKKVKQECLKFV